MVNANCKGDRKLLVLSFSMFCLKTMRLESRLALSFVVLRKTDFILLIASEYSFINEASLFLRINCSAVINALASLSVNIMGGIL
ncbi:hypothetical protein D3C84_859570 [compost metagenome]